MISSIKTSAYNAFSTIAAKVQATSLWSQLPAKSTVATVASNVLFSKYTHAVIGVGIFVKAAQCAYSNYRNLITRPTYRKVEDKIDENGKDYKFVNIKFNHTLKAKISVVILPSLIATAALSATLARVILLP